MPRPMPKKFNFKRELTARLEGAGAVADPQSGGAYSHTLQTRVGLMRLSVWVDSMVSRFDDAARACADPMLKGELRMCCTKWNFHFDKPEQEHVDYVVAHVNRLMRIPQEPRQDLIKEKAK